MFQRLHNPMVQNKILVLQGGQGIGKDTWISMLVDGLGQFSIPLAVIKEDKDTYLNLHRGLVMKISEFDKTARAEVSTLKDIITAPSTNLRAPYDKDSKVRMSRCSFISSANVEDLLRDYTGNRRFLIFEIESIKYEYEKWSEADKREWQLQCLAEMRQLAADNYTALESSVNEMREYIETWTPTDPAEDAAGRFIQIIKGQQGEVEWDIAQDLNPTDDRVVDAINTISKELGLRWRAVSSMLRRKLGVKRRVGGARTWVYRIPKA